ncbi:hypothetical protein [Winogradskyella ouciana]|uniref:Uncharacterized protein n=1 Tax=Winogradskyella ouciana TaxID=2608631 RepID=A0A7K1GDV6_9FLAO|nr:hypothetical protein [Winogradskyella ouciana]MTE27281.1 hypothetical protein [Winogradskyella ouciana]
MQKIKFIFKLLLAIATLFFTYIYISSIYVLPWEKQEAIEATIEMGGLDELPQGIKNLSIKKRGSIFTRQYIIEFELDNAKEIDNWIKRSKRLKDNIPKIKGNTKTFEIYPGENDSYGGEVEINDNKIRIDMSWS